MIKNILLALLTIAFFSSLIYGYYQQTEARRNATLVHKIEIEAQKQREIAIESQYELEKLREECKQSREN